MPLLSREDCVTIIRECIGSSNFEIIDWETTGRDVDEKMGYMGDHARTAIMIIHGGREEKHSFFLKLTADNDAVAEFIQGIGAANKELIYYQRCEPELRRRVPSDDKLWGCRCYLVKQDLLVMEDLAVQGFRGFGSRDVVDFDHCALVIDALVALHSASIAYEEEKSVGLGKPFRLIEEYPEMVAETFYAREPYKEEFTEAGIKAFMACASQLPVCRDPMKRVLIEEKLPKVLRRMYDMVKPSAEDRNVLTHSDLWLNNIMFRYDGAGRPVDARLIDWQLLRYGPPADDVLQFLHACLPKSDRARYEAALLDRYHTSLSAALGRRGLSCERLLPRAAFQASIARRRLLARLTAVYMNHFVMLDAGALAQRFADPSRYRSFMFGEERAAFVSEQFAGDAAYRSRMGETLQELIDEHVL